MRVTPKPNCSTLKRFELWNLIFMTQKLRIWQNAMMAMRLILKSIPPKTSETISQKRSAGSCKNTDQTPIQCLFGGKAACCLRSFCCFKHFDRFGYIMSFRLFEGLMHGVNNTCISISMAVILTVMAINTHALFANFFWITYTMLFFVSLLPLGNKNSEILATKL